MKKIMVTGCAGFVGSCICDKALAKGYDVVGIDNLSSGVNFVPDGVKFYKTDLINDISEAMNDVDAVIHAAAYAELRGNWIDRERRERLFINNEIATRNVLETMPDVPIVFLSSASVYGSLSDIENRILTEQDAKPSTIESPYAASKLACEAYISAWAYKRKTPSYIFRLVNQVGARTHRGVITDFVNMAKTKKHIHAADNGNQRKSWISVEDTADCTLAVLEKNAPTGIYNISSSERWSWRNITHVMNMMYQEKYPNQPEPFVLTYEDCMAGTIGDPVNIYISNDKINKYHSCKRPIIDSVRQALLSLNWV